MSLRDQPVADPPAALHDLAVMPGWLTDAADPDVVAAGLRATVPELANGARTIVECSPKLRMKDGPRPGWSASYRVTVADSSGVRETVELVGTFLPPGPAGGPGTSTGAFGSRAPSARRPRAPSARWPGPARSQPSAWSWPWAGPTMPCRRCP